MDFIEKCRAFIEIDSTPSVGTIEIAQFAAGLCEAAGLHVELQKENLNGLAQANVIARPSALMPDQEFLLQTHLDTVDPGNYALWSKTGFNPFSPAIYLDAIYGLGAADVKLDFICKLEALGSFSSVKSWKLPPVLVGTFGEELGMAGAIKLISKKKVSAKMALVGEPTELRLANAGKGFGVVEIEIPFSNEERDFRERHNSQEGTSTQSKMFVGRAAHSSVPELGDSAILKMLDYLSKLPDGLVVMEIDGGVNFNTVPASAVLEIAMVGGLENTICTKIKTLLRSLTELEKDFLKYPDEKFAPPYPTLNIGMARTFIDHVKFSGCFRMPTTVNNEIYERWMNRLRSDCQSVGASFRVTEYKQPFQTSLESPLVKICQQQSLKQGLSLDCGALSVTNEASVFRRFGIDCVAIGPGQGVGNSHTPEEHVTIQQLDSAVEFYKGVIERVCL